MKDSSMDSSNIDEKNQRINIYTNFNIYNNILKINKNYQS